MLHTIYLGLGSNKNPDQNIQVAIEALKTRFGDVLISPIYRSVAVGFSGDDFLNAVAMAKTDLSVSELKKYLTALEDQAGRDRAQPKFSDRVLDIDILLYNDWVGEFDGLVLPRDEITQYAHVLKPLADLAPDLIHPGTQQTYRALWDGFMGHRDLIPYELSSHHNGMHEHD